MSDRPADSSEKDWNAESIREAVLQLEIFLQKYPPNARKDPETLRELGTSVWKSLLKIVDRAFLLPATTLDTAHKVMDSVGTFVGGVARTPDAANQRLIDHRRVASDAAEEQKQAQAQDKALGEGVRVINLKPTPQAIQRIDAHLLPFRERGLFAQAVPVKGLCTLIILCKHEDLVRSVIEGKRILSEFQALPAPARRLELPAPVADEFSGLKPQCARALIAAGINLAVLQTMSDDALLGIPGIGRKSFAVIREWLATQDGTS